MFWLARAVIASQDGTYPYKHDSVEKRFSEIVAARGGETRLAEAVSVYANAARIRSQSDYQMTFTVDADRAGRLVEQAERFFHVVMSAFSLHEEP